MLYIYVLKLIGGKYYVGKTSNPDFRLNSHFNSDGSEWTKIYKPIKVLKIKKNCDNYDEDKITRQYMDKYGIDNVRGGSFVSINLKKSDINTLEKMSNGTNNKCFNCGLKGHFANKCPNNFNVWCCEYCDKEFDTEKGCLYHENVYCKKKFNTNNYYKNNNKQKQSCYRCGRKGHYSSSCYASTHINGYYLN